MQRKRGNMHGDCAVIDCDLQPQPDGLFRCSRCGWTYHKLVRRNCPGAVSPPSLGARVRTFARALRLWARDGFR